MFHSKQKFRLFFSLLNLQKGLPTWLSGKESACQCRRHGFDPWVGKIPWSRKWQPTLVLLPGESHGQRSLAGYSPWGRRESDMTYRLNSKPPNSLILLLTHSIQLSLAIWKVPPFGTIIEEIYLPSRP